MSRNAQEGVTITIAGCDQRVVYSAGRVLDEGEDGAAAIGAKDVADLWHKPKGMRTGVLHRHELTQVIAIERPSVYHLLSVGIDDQYVLPPRNVRRLAPSCRYLNRGCIHSPTSLGFGSARAASHCMNFRCCRSSKGGTGLNCQFSTAQAAIPVCVATLLKYHFAPSRNPGGRLPPRAFSLL